VLGLFSGHGVLPLRGNRMTRAYDHQSHPRAGLRVVDEGAGFYAGQLLSGRCTGAEDWALASFPHNNPSELDAHHLAAGGPPPIRTRTTALVGGERVWHYSRLPGRHKRLSGTVRHQSLRSVELLLPDGSELDYRDVVCVVSEPNQRFSLEGDSGSLVVDMQQRAIGTIVGGTSDGTLSYVLGMAGLQSALGSLYAKIFR
jgi:hypothetical protein